MHRYMLSSHVDLNYMTLTLVHPDNAAMIAWASMERFLSKDTDPYDIDLLPKWSLEDLRKPGDTTMLRL